MGVMLSNLLRITKRYRQTAWRIPGYMLGTIAGYWVISHYRDSFFVYMTILSVVSLTANWIVSRLLRMHQGTRVDSTDNKGAG